MPWMSRIGCAYGMTRARRSACVSGNCAEARDAIVRQLRLRLLDRDAGREPAEDEDRRTLRGADIATDRDAAASSSCD